MNPHDINHYLPPPAQNVEHYFCLGLPLRSPVALMRDLGLPGRGPFVFLDSAGGDPELCRYSFLAWDPRVTISIRDRRLSITTPPAGSLVADIAIDDPFEVLREMVRAQAPQYFAQAVEYKLPITGGAFGVFAYDAGRYIERLPEYAADDMGLPEIDFIFPRKLICCDHQRSLAHVFLEDPSRGEAEAVEEALYRQRTAVPAAAPAGIERHAYGLSSATRSNLTRLSFQHMVRRAQEYILAGDIFQANLSQRLQLEYEGDSLDLYQALRQINPSPFAGYLDMGGYTVISSSPERLVQLDGRLAQTRPIAGTRRRGVDMGEDSDLTEELNLDPKERAEHIMLVDLERNDLGRVSDYGSVAVNELMVNESYSHVIHIVSNVRGLLHQSKDALDLLRAMFPGGTITGCPKVRCMEIIDELEPVRRGLYTGSFGYIGYNGNMDMNIIIRTLVRVGNMLYAQAGAGIVADSDAEREYRETLRKAEAMVRAVELVKDPAHGSGFRVSG
jgi:aminodeoxychorismate synthase component I